MGIWRSGFILGFGDEQLFGVRRGRPKAEFLGFCFPPSVVLTLCSNQTDSQHDDANR